MRNRNYEEGTWDAAGCSAFMAGALIGAGVALLFAPQPGTELRGRMRDYANRATDDLLDKGQAAWDTAIERGREYYDKGEEIIRDAGRSARELAKQGQQAAKEAGRAAKEEFVKQRQDMARETRR